MGLILAISDAEGLLTLTSPEPCAKAHSVLPSNQMRALGELSTNFLPCTTIVPLLLPIAPEAEKEAETQPRLSALAVLSRTDFAVCAAALSAENAPRRSRVRSFIVVC